MKKLSPEIVQYLAKKMDLQPSTVSKNIYLLQKDYPNLTKNALAQIYARKNTQTIYRKLDKQDRESLPSTEVVPEKIKVSQKTNVSKTNIKTVFEYDSDDYFIKGHINELNRAYSFGCYTSVFILLRKIIENLIVDILRAQYSGNNRQNKELYYNISHKRFQDFSVILKNLYDKRDDFGTNNKAVARLYNLSKKMKDDTNDKTHSWFHLVERKAEIENLNAIQIIEIIKILEKQVGIR